MKKYEKDEASELETFHEAYRENELRDRLSDIGEFVKWKSGMTRLSDIRDGDIEEGTSE